jgi:hypothetical protein
MQPASHCLLQRCGTGPIHPRLQRRRVAWRRTNRGFSHSHTSARVNTRYEEVFSTRPAVPLVSDSPTRPSAEHDEVAGSRSMTLTPPRVRWPSTLSSKVNSRVSIEPVSGTHFGFTPDIGRSLLFVDRPKPSPSVTGVLTVQQGHTLLAIRLFLGVWRPFSSGRYCTSLSRRFSRYGVHQGSLSARFRQERVFVE